MKRFIFGFIALLLITGAVSFNSCNNKTSNCNWKISSTEQITFNLMDETIGYEVDIRTYETERNFVECAAQKANEKVFQYFKNYCIDKGLVLDNKTMTFVIYYDEHITQLPSITDEHIKGISIYKVEGDKIMHHLYVRDEYSNFLEVENVNVAVPGVTLNHIFFYLENYVFTDVHNVSFIILSGNFGVDIYKNIKKYRITPMRLEVSSTQKKPITELAQQGGGVNPDGCNYCGGTDGFCDFDGNGIFRCFGGCSRQVAHYGGEQFIYVYDQYLMYNFGYVLSNSDKGQEYINHYYYLSEEWEGKMNAELALQTISVLKDCNPAISAFVEPDKYMDEVMIDTKLSTSLLNLLDSYEKITKSNEGKKILYSVREDIRLFSNLKLKEILDMLK